MAWSAPRTWVTGEVVSAAMMNTNIRDNTNALIAQSAHVATSETTTSTTYVDLATVGPSVTVDTGDRTSVLLIFGQLTQNNTANSGGRSTVVVSGATTITAADNWFAGLISATANAHGVPCCVYSVAVNAGSNTFKMQYRANTSGTATFLNRSLAVMIL